MDNTLQLQLIREALRGPDGSMHFVQTFSHGIGIQVKVKSRKIGPIILPSEGQTVADVAYMLLSDLQDAPVEEENPFHKWARENPDKMRDMDEMLTRKSEELEGRENGI